jgi:hypothetical protein
MRRWDVKPRAKESGRTASSKFLSRPCGKGKTSVFSPQICREVVSNSLSVVRRYSTGL